MSADAPSSELLVTAEDHLAGYKEIEVHFRAGGSELLKLTAPSRAAVRGLGQRFAQGGDISLLTAICLPDPVAAVCDRPASEARRAQSAATFMDRLTPQSGDLVEAVCFALAFGLEAEKKMSAFGQALTTRSTLPEPSSGSSSPAGAGQTLSAGAGPTSG